MLYRTDRIAFFTLTGIPTGVKFAMGHGRERCVC